MTVVEFQATITVPPDQVFANVSDLTKHVEWSGGQAIRKTSAGPIAVGSTYETEEKGPFGRTIRERSIVLLHDPSARFAWRSFGPLGTWLDWTFELRSQNGGTLLTQRMEPRKSLLTTIACKLFIERAMRKSMPESLTKIKASLESNRS